MLMAPTFQTLLRHPGVSPADTVCIFSLLIRLVLESGQGLEYEGAFAVAGFVHLNERRENASRVSFGAML